MKPSRRAAVPPFAVMSILNRVAELRAQGGEIISLCAGEPSQGAPADVRRRAAELMINRTPLGYTETFGIKPLRREIAEHYRRWYSLDIDEDHIALTTGSSGAFLLSFLAAFDHGDRVALTRPGYPAYRNILASLGCQVVELGVGGNAGGDTRCRTPGGTGGRLSGQSHGHHDRSSSAGRARWLVSRS
jgi:aspartate/methionine/tyrosine aminotransferase